MQIPPSLKSLATAVLVALGLATAARATDDAEKAWLQNFDARERYFAQTLGPLPRQIVKLRNMKDVWPGGGIFVIPATKIGPGLTAYVTSGLTNIDLPAPTKSGKQPPDKPGVAGYGFEILVLAAPDTRWPLNFLANAVRDVIEKDDDVLGKVDAYGGFTVAGIDGGPAGPLNLLVARARPPLAAGTQLPGGRMAVLVATTITDDELRWTEGYRREALLDKLAKAGIGQVSRPGRPSVIK